MSRRTLLTLLFALMAYAFRAAPADSLFLSVPSALLPQLGTIERLTLLNAYATHPDEATAENALEGTSRLTFRSDSLLCLTLSAAGTWQLLALPGGNVAVASTTLLPAHDTRIKLYSPAWELLADVTPRFSPADFWLSTPATVDAPPGNDASAASETRNERADSLPDWRREQLRTRLRPLYVGAEFLRSNPRLVSFSVSVPNATPADSAALSRLLRPAVRYRWEGSKLVPVG